MNYKYFSSDIKNLTELRNRLSDLLSSVNGKDYMVLSEDILAEYRMMFYELRDKNTGIEAENPEDIWSYDISSDRRICEKIVQISELKNLRCEVLGNFIWISESQGENYKNELLNLGFKLSKKRKKYFWSSGAPMKRNYKPVGSFNDIRKKYGQA